MANNSSAPNDPQPPYDITAYGPPRVSGHAVEADMDIKSFEDATQCLVLDARTVTRDELLARGLSEASADELIAFAAHLRAKRAAL